MPFALIPPPKEGKVSLTALNNLIKLIGFASSIIFKYENFMVSSLQGI